MEQNHDNIIRDFQHIFHGQIQMYQYSDIQIMNSIKNIYKKYK